MAIDSPPANPSTVESNKRATTSEFLGPVIKRSARDPRFFKIKEPSPIYTSNKFEVLHTVSEELQSTEDVPPAEAGATSSKVNKPPPIYLRSTVFDFKKLVRLLENKGGKDSFTCLSTTRGITIRPATPDAYRAFVTALKDEGAEYHTYQLHEDKAYRVVIRGLHQSIPTEDIKVALEEKGFTVRAVNYVLNKSKEHLPIFFIDLEPNIINDTIFNIKSLLFCSVRVEEPRRNRLIVQCVKCQQFGHTKSYCYYQPRCVRCGGPHASTVCSKRKEERPTCANCGGQHPANYRGCIIHKDLQARRSQPTRKSALPIRNCPPTVNSGVEFPPLQRNQAAGTTQLSSDNNTLYSKVTSSNNNKNNTNINFSCTNSNNNSDNYNSNANHINIVNSDNCKNVRTHPFHSTSSSSYHYNSPHSSHMQTTSDVASLSNILSQLQSVLQPLLSLVTQLTNLTQAFMCANGR